MSTSLSIVRTYLDAMARYVGPLDGQNLARNLAFVQDLLSAGRPVSNDSEGLPRPSHSSADEVLQRPTGPTGEGGEPSVDDIQHLETGCL